MNRAIGRGFVVILMTAIVGSGLEARGQGESPTRRTPDAPSTVLGLTSPRQRVVLAAVIPGRIARISVPEGEIVRTGDTLVALDDAVQTWRTEMARAAAESTQELALARERHQRALLDVERLVQLRGDDSASSKELRDARIAAEIERIGYEAARFDREQAQRAFEREQATLAEYQIRAPFSGYVVEHLKHEGEAVDALVGIVALAQLDPLQVALDCPLELSGRIRPGDRWMIQPESSGVASREGTVAFANRVADGASQTFRVKLSVENADGAWVAGMRVRVNFADGPIGSPESDSPRATTSVPGSDASRAASVNGNERRSLE